MNTLASNCHIEWPQLAAESNGYWELAHASLELITSKVSQSQSVNTLLSNCHSWLDLKPYTVFSDVAVRQYAMPDKSVKRNPVVCNSSDRRQTSVSLSMTTAYNFKKKYRSIIL